VKRFWIVPMALMALAIPGVVLALGGEGGFEGVVHSIEVRYHERAKHIPFLGLVSLLSNKATHGGVSRLNVAEFDQFSQPVDGNELNRMVEEKLGAGWERMIRETSRKGLEQTLIFIHPEGERMGMFVVDLDGNEMDVVEVSVDPKHLDEDIGHYRHHHPEGDQGNDKSAGQPD
jgi:hypothetical protein